LGKAKEELESRLGELLAPYLESGDVVPPKTIMSLVRKETEAGEKTKVEKYLLNDFPWHLQHARLAE